MLRKLSHISLVLLLLVSTMGVTVSKHYCGSKLVDVSVLHGAEKCCDDAGSSKCCHDETAHFEVDNDFIVLAQNVMFASIAIDLFIPVVTETIFNLVDNGREQAIDFAPPPPFKVLSFLTRIQVYRL